MGSFITAPFGSLRCNSLANHISGGVNLPTMWSMWTRPTSAGPRQQQARTVALAYLRMWGSVTEKPKLVKTTSSSRDVDPADRGRSCVSRT